MKYTYNIEQEEYPDDPRSWDNETEMIFFHTRYSIGDKHDYEEEQYENWEDMRENIESHNPDMEVLPVYMYDHSGLALSLGSFSCNWDSGQIGFIVTPSEEIAKLDLEIYQRYINGEVYCLTIFENGEEIECFGGFYGYDEAENEAKSYIKYFKKQDKKDKRKQLAIYIKNSVPLEKRWN